MYEILKIYNLHHRMYELCKGVTVPIPCCPDGVPQRSGFITSVVGENGPELIMLPDSQRVFPAFIEQNGAKIGTAVTRDGTFDIVIERAFTPFAKATITRID